MLLASSSRPRVAFGPATATLVDRQIPKAADQRLLRAGSQEDWLTSMLHLDFAFSMNAAVVDGPLFVVTSKIANGFPRAVRPYP